MDRNQTDGQPRVRQKAQAFKSKRRGVQDCNRMPGVTDRCDQGYTRRGAHRCRQEPLRRAFVRPSSKRSSGASLRELRDVRDA